MLPTVVQIEETREVLRDEEGCKAKTGKFLIYNGKPPQDEGRSATGACTSYAATGTVIAALMQTRAVLEGKVAMFKDTPSDVSVTVRKGVSNEVIWMVYRQLHQWHSEAGGVSNIDHKALVVD